MPRSVRITKRLMDIVISLSVLIGGIPFFTIIAILIKLDSKGPVFYKQRRVMRCSNPEFGDICTPDKACEFDVIKFRTMHEDAEAHSGAVNASENDPRVTRVGRFLRPVRFDELPNFINVLKGEMSVVGPRADRKEIFEEVIEYFPLVMERTSFVKPGITGLAQIKLRSNGTLNGDITFSNTIPFADLVDESEVHSFRYKLYFDFAYQMKMTKFWSFLITDIKIMFMTPIVMFVRRNTI